MARALWIVTFLFGVLLLTSSFVKADDDALGSTEGEDSEDDSSEEPNVEEDNGVLVLGNDNFDDAINSNEIILVEFYAPWCGHCKSLAPEYEAAAKILKENDPAIPLAKVDATVHSELGTRFEVSGYPTLKVFKNGQPTDYEGPRDTEGIVEYMKERGDPNWKPPPAAALTLTKENFADYINKEDLMLVEFYAPWCGHCKKLAPEYEKAAQALKEDDPPILLGTVDATTEPELAKEYDVTGYPTLKMFRKGKAFEYKGERTSHGIMDYMRKQVGEASKESKTLKDVKAYMNDFDVTVVGFFGSEEDAGFDIFQEAANDLREEFTYTHTFDAAAMDNYRVNAGSVGVFNAERFYTKYDKKWHILDKIQDKSLADVKQFFNDHQIPLVSQLDSQSRTKRYTKRPLCIFFYTVDWSFDYRKTTQLWRHKIADIAKDFPSITFAVSDEDEQKDLIKEFGFEESGEEMNVGCIGENERRYPMEDMEEWEEDDIREFIEKFKNGELKPRLKSQQVPKKQGFVKTVVANSFDEIVMDETKDVLIEFYAPWCGHCKTLEPKYKALAKKLKGEKNLVIAKIDATANDSPTEYGTQGFPTIFFAPANNKKTPIKYDGPREADDFEKFIKEHATVSFGKSIKEEL